MNFDFEVEQLAARILRRSANEQEALGHMMLAATHFIGGAAGILKRISEKKKGPVLDIIGWSEQVTSMIISDSRKHLRQ